ncbi:hypothetical protein TNCV_3227851 [Trichonephila clavipes]|nr:hypothetical protein TNCV_3227851 [Trichonephila clavipes]
MGRTILLERRQSESVGRRNSRTTFLRSDWPRPFARREVGVEMDWVEKKNREEEVGGGVIGKLGFMKPNLTLTSLAFYKPYSKCKKFSASFPHYSVR